MRTSAPFYYQVAERNLSNVYGLPFDWSIGDADPVIRLTLDRQTLLWMASLVRREAATDGAAGELQAVAERVDRIIASEMAQVEGDAFEASQKVAHLRYRYGLSS